jgi:uncharacterized coiled-coil protein SlyX
MSTVTTDDNETIVTTEGSTEELIEELVDVVNRQSKQIDELQATVEEQSARIDDLEDTATVEWDSADHKDLCVESTDGTVYPLGQSLASKPGETDVEERIDDVEERLSSSQGMGTEEGNTYADDCVTPQTPLEQTVGLPQELVDGESANVQRAVFIARDVDDYTTSVPAGRAITSGELRRVLKAGTDCNGHSQTVDRVITVLDSMGQDDVKVIERRGERRIVFTEELCHRLKELSQDEREANHDVVMEQEV